MADFYTGAADQDKGPDNPSSDYAAMLPYWQMVEAINGGAETIRAAGELYLPRMTNESPEDYRLRRKYAPYHARRQRCSAFQVTQPWDVFLGRTDVPETCLGFKNFRNSPKTPAPTHLRCAAARKRSRVAVVALKSDGAAEKLKDPLSRDFLGRSIFDFCNNSLATFSAISSQSHKYA